MSKYRVMVKLSGLEIEVEGEHAPELAQNISRHLSSIIQPAALLDAPQDPPPVTSSGAVPTNGSRRRRKASAPAVGGGASSVDWNHDASKWGTPRQEWRLSQKLAWLLYVIEQANNQKQELGASILANVFNENFKSAGVVHQSNVARDLKKEPDLFGELRGKWFLKDAGRQAAIKLVAEATGQAAAVQA